MNFKRYIVTLVVETTDDVGTLAETLDELVGPLDLGGYRVTSLVSLDEVPTDENKVMMNADTAARFYVDHAPWSEEDDPEVWCVYWDHENEEINNGEALSVACFKTMEEAEVSANAFRRADALWDEANDRDHTLGDLVTGDLPELLANEPAEVIAALVALDEAYNPDGSEDVQHNDGTDER